MTSPCSLRLDDDAPDDLTPSVWASADPDARFGKPDSMVTVIGWGATTEGGNTTPELKEVDLKVQTSTDCERNYRQAVPSARITSHMLCAGEPAGGKDSCQGDSGGFLGAPNGKSWVQLGIVSWGIGCAQPNLYGVYTRVGD
ncbi:serine protease [Bradyrhizobium sp. CCGB12]|uniref:serine protease n=1 Tax=Bradyrhizobium sp. CCGB12 TaxID=2949632 RepID=UPI0020B3875E|nr:serine protease [Bradyrhizobium sp. CCGB12]MCP3395306.1 serine protease [Bradyrhizobium sp. CCGB12]